MIDTPDPAVMPDEEVIPPPSTPKPVEPAPEPAEEASAEDATPEEEPAEEEDKPKSKTSGYARLKARHQRVLADLELERRKNAQFQAPQQQEPAEKEPKPEDFGGDYLAFEKAAIAFSAKQSIREELAKARQQDAAVREAESRAASRHETLEDFFERTEEVKTNLKDFDVVIDQMRRTLGPLPETVADKIAEADNGPQILYYLAKNPGAAREIYEAGPLDALYQIGRLDEKMSLPSARKETKAPPPINPPKGGASPPRDIYGIATRSEDISDYVKARKAMKKDE